ncbi:unnamed protein product [Ectocarpus sp. CCAP 1310/34]|nr:unnamed protein product [Ectocarpus sp. CCAP 1310/34]
MVEAGHASADNGAQETPAQQTPVVSQVKPDTKETAPVRAIEGKGGGDKPATRQSRDPAAATTSSEGVRTKKGQDVSGVERQPTPRPGHGSSRAAGKWKGTPVWRTSPEQGKSATNPRNTALLSGMGAFFVTPEQTSPCKLRYKCSRVHSNRRSSPPSARSPGLAETATTPTGTASSTAARVPASDNPASRKPPDPAKAATTPRGTAASTGARFSSTDKQLSTTTGHRNNNDDRLAAIGRSNPSSTASPHPVKTVTTPRGTASLTATRVPSSARQIKTPIPTNHRIADRAVKIGQGNPASTTSPHPAKTATTPKNTAVSTGNRVLFGTRQPTTPATLHAGRTAKDATISPASTPSPHPTKTAVTTPRGTAASTSTRVPSSARQPTTPTGRRGNHKDRAVTIRRGNPASTTSPHLAKVATTPRDRAILTGNRDFFGPRQPTTPTSLRVVRAVKNAKIGSASTPSPQPAEAAVTTPRGMATSASTASASTLVLSSARQPTTPTGRRAKTPTSTPSATRDRISLVARQAAEEIRRRSMSARAFMNRGGKLASGRSPEQADATTPSEISSLLADTSSSAVASNSAQGLGSTSSGGTIEGRHATAELSAGAPADPGSGVEPSPIVPAMGEKSLLEAGGQTRDHPVQRPRSDFAPRPTCSMAEYMMPQIQLLNALQRTVLLSPF